MEEVEFRNELIILIFTLTKSTTRSRRASGLLALPSVGLKTASGQTIESVSIPNLQSGRAVHSSVLLWDMYVLPQRSCWSLVRFHHSSQEVRSLCKHWDHEALVVDWTLAFLHRSQINYFLLIIKYLLYYWIIIYFETFEKIQSDILIQNM